MDIPPGRKYDFLEEAFDFPEDDYNYDFDLDRRPLDSPPCDEGFIAPDILRIVHCFRQLRCLAHDVFECLECSPTAKRLMTVFTCILLNDLRFIESRLADNNNASLSLNSIFNEVVLINNAVNDPVFGLSEIKNEVRFIGNAVLHPADGVTSGPVWTDPAAGLLNIKVLNNTATDQTVHIHVRQLNACPGSEIFSGALRVNGLCSGGFSAIDLGTGANQIPEFEILITGLTAGLYPSAIQTLPDGAVVSSTFLPAAAFVPGAGSFAP